MKLVFLRHKSAQSYFAIVSEERIVTRNDTTRRTDAFYIHVSFLCRPAVGPTNYQEIVKFQSNFPPLFIDAAKISQTALFVLNTAI